MNAGMWIAIVVAIFAALYFGNKVANKKNKK